MRCSLGPKKVKRLAEKYSLPIISACTRGGTGHRIDVWLANGETGSIFPDGEYVTEKQMQANMAEAMTPSKKTYRPLLNLGPMTRKEQISLEMALMA